MTNLEWLRTLSAEKLVDFLKYGCCVMCTHREGEAKCPAYIYDCTEGKLTWLNREHEGELKPCPFCGAEGDFINRDSNVFWVQCRNCGSHGTQSRTQRAAIEAWNRRISND